MSQLQAEIDWLRDYPELLSPAHLGQATFPDWKTPPHLRHLNEHLVALYDGRISNLMANMPPQHGKSNLATRLNTAWVLLRNPNTRVIVIGHERDFAETEYGLQIRDVFNRWGKRHGLELREDSKKKGEWKIDGYRGGVVCRGWQGGVSGRPAELFVIDDIIKGPEQALSMTVTEAHWRFYMTVVFGRRRNMTKLLLVGTRWSKMDLFGRVLRLAARTGERWTHLKFKAIAEENDILGRKPGEALWPENVSLERLQVSRQEEGRWFRAGWQQEPSDEEGSFFKPGSWPVYADIGGAWSVPAENGGIRNIWQHVDGITVIVVDWAASEKRQSDHTAIGVFTVLPDGRLLVRHLRREKIAIDQVVHKLAEECRTWRPSVVVVEAEGFQAALANECRRYGEIPEVRPVKAQGKTKLMRAYPAIVMGQNRRILLPDPAVSAAPRTTAAEDADGYGDSWRWLEKYTEELTAFTGTNDESDDQVDVTAYAAQQAMLLKGSGRPLTDDNAPCILTAGKEMG